MAVCATGSQIRPLVVTVPSVLSHPLQFLPLDLAIRGGSQCHVWHFRYQSAGSGGGSLADQSAALADLLREVRGYGDYAPVHFVAHGAGALVLRRAFRQIDVQAGWHDTRVVMIAPCNRGSRFARSLAESPARRLLAWSPLLEDLSRMSPEEADAVGALPPMANPLVVTGTLGWNPWVGERSDGRVGVSETQLGSAACAQLSVPCSHSLLLYHPWVLAQTSRFLRTGAMGGRGPGDGDRGRERHGDAFVTGPPPDAGRRREGGEGAS